MSSGKGHLLTIVPSIVCCRKILRDAIPMINTEASVAFISDMVLAGKVNGMEADIWLTSMAFIGKPTAAMLASLTVRHVNPS